MGVSKEISTFGAYGASELTIAVGTTDEGERMLTVTAHSGDDRRKPIKIFFVGDNPTRPLYEALRQAEAEFASLRPKAVAR